MADENDFMNVSDGAALLGVHIQTLRRLARQKKIPAFKLGRDWRFRRQALVRWADEQHQPRNSESTPYSILIIDDDENTCASLARMVEQFGCQSRQATDGTTGLALAGRETPDLILLDLKLHDMNAPQFLTKLRATHPHLPVVIAAEHPASDLMKEAAGLAPVLLLVKPVEQTPLERTIRALLGPRVVAKE